MALFKYIGLYVSLLMINTAHIARYSLARIIGSKGLAGVRVIISDGHSVLLVRARHAPFAWTLPGGGVQRGESTEAAAQREVLEETGLSITMIDGVIGSYTDRFGQNDTVTVFCTTHFSGTLTTRVNFEIIERRWFDLHALPRNISPIHRKHLEKYLGGARNEHGPLRK